MAYFVSADVVLYALSARLQLAQIASWPSRVCFSPLFPETCSLGAGLTRLIAVNVGQLGVGAGKQIKRSANSAETMERSGVVIAKAGLVIVSIPSRGVFSELDLHEAILIYSLDKSISLRWFMVVSVSVLELSSIFIEDRQSLWNLLALSKSLDKLIECSFI